MLDLRVIKSIAVIVLMCLVGLWLNNTSITVSVPPETLPKLVAHRGVHQVYAGTNLTGDTCRASHVAQPSHPFIENTLPSILAAFDYGADVVEVDVHLTTDDVFAVFHDWNLECQTDGEGTVREKSFSYLKSLDLGFGFTTDGKQFPFRETARGMMPSLADVLANAGDEQILVNFKSNVATDGTKFSKFLQNQGGVEKIFGVYGGKRPTTSAMKAIPGLYGFARQGVVDCLKSYAAWGWSGYVPNTCRNTVVAVPINYAGYLWGWPRKFTKRMNDAGSRVILFGPYNGSGFSSGIDTIELLDSVPQEFDGWIWTNRIELIGPALKLKKKW